MELVVDSNRMHEGRWWLSIWGLGKSLRARARVCYVMGLNS